MSRYLCILMGALLLNGCVVISSKRHPVTGKKCPPGHVWSDGKCHNKGKGHDKNKGKGNDNNNGNNGNNGKGKD